MKPKPLFLRSFIILAGLLLVFRVSAQYKFPELDKFLQQKRFALGNNVCTLIWYQGAIVYENNLGNYTKETQELIASCSKWLTAALAMTFVDEGKLSVDDAVAKYLPEFNAPGKDKITIRNCMSHTSGIKSEPVTLASIMQRRKYATLKDEVADFARQPMDGEPGKVFAYSSVGLNTVGRVLEVISGKDFADLFNERIAVPLEMYHTTFAGKNAVNPSGGARSTAADYMHFLEMILNKGVYNGKRILSEASVYQMQQSETANAKVLYTPEGGEGFEYGFGEWVQAKDNTGRSTVVSSPGLFGTFPCVDISRQYAVIVFVKNLKVRNRREIYGTVLDIIDKTIPSQDKH